MSFFVRGLVATLLLVAAQDVRAADLLLAQADIPSLPVPHLPSAQAQPMSKDCGDKPQITETSGIVSLKLDNPCRRQSLVNVQADGLKLGATFNGDGRAALQFPLFHPSAEIAWEQADGSVAKTPVIFAGFKDVVRIALVWRSHVALALHVVEPGASLNSASGQVRIDASGAIGASEFSAVETSVIDADPVGNMLVYTLPAEKNPGKGLLSYYVEFISRGEQPTGLFCGDGALASPDFEIWILRYGETQKLQRGVAPAPCDRPLSDKVRVQRLGDVSLARD